MAKILAVNFPSWHERLDFKLLVKGGAASLLFLSLLFFLKSLVTAVKRLRVTFYETQGCVVARAFVFISASAPAVGAAAVSQRRRNRSAGSRAPRGFFCCSWCRFQLSCCVFGKCSRLVASVGADLFVCGSLQKEITAERQEPRTKFTLHGNRVVLILDCHFGCGTNISALNVDPEINPISPCYR